MSLIPSERRLYDCLLEFASLQGYPPTIQEIKNALQASSTSWVQDLLDRLQNKGYIERRPGRARAIALRSTELPLRGWVQAGYLTEHPQCCDRIRLDGKLYAPGDYALKVTGDSMVNAQILDGDVVVMRSNHDIWALHPGQIAVVWIAGEGATLKHVYCQEDNPLITLRPASGNHPPRTLERQYIGLQGVMVGLHRNDNGLWGAVAY